MTLPLKLARTMIIPIVVLVISVLALLSWQFGLSDWLLTMNPHGPAIRPIGAWGFALSGLICLLAKRALDLKTRSGFFVTLATMWLFFIVAVTTLDVMAEGALGVHSLMVAEKVGIRAEGYPAVATLIALFLMGCQGLAVTFNSGNYPRRSRIIGSLLLIVGIIPLIGHALHVGALTLDFPGDTPAMSVPSALMAFLLGVQVAMQANCHTRCAAAHRAAEDAKPVAV